MRAGWMVLLAGLLAVTALPARAQDALYRMPGGETTHWASPENATGAKGAAGAENKGGKGHAFDSIAAGQSLTLADITGSGVIDRIWMTINDRSAESLRAMRLDIYWDGAKTPAVSAPLGDFFLHNSGEMKPLQSDLLVSAEGRSFVSYIAMPFRKSARVVVTNEGATPVTLYFDVDYRAMALPADALYFHAWWSRDRATTPGRDFTVLPRIEGHGRFLGMSVGVQTNPAYGKSWWGEGEVRMYLDGDRGLASLSGTGTEDYIGSGWGQGVFADRYQGSPVADDTTGRWSFYRFHIPDPVLFTHGIRVVWQQIGGAGKAEVIAMQAKGAPLIPVTIAPYGPQPFMKLLDAPKALDDPAMPADGWTNFYRSDDVSAVAYFYLDRPENGLPPIAPAAERTRDLRAAKPQG